MTLELLNQRFPPPGGQSFRAHHRPLRLAERIWILKPQHAHLAHHAQGDRVVLHDGYLRLHLDLQVIRAARCRRGQAGENAAPALFVLIDLDCGGSFVSRRHNKANPELRQHAKGRTTCHNGLPLPRNQRKFPQRHLVAGIGEALPFYELASGPARLSFIRFGQVSSFSPLFGWWFTQSGPSPLARALCRQHNRCKLWIGDRSNSIWGMPVTRRLIARQRFRTSPFCSMEHNALDCPPTFWHALLRSPQTEERS